MIAVPGSPDPPVPRLLEALAARPDAGGGRTTMILSSGSAASEADARTILSGSAERVLVLGSTGTHRDARAPRLRRLWALEELARSTALPVLALRLGPLLGPHSPLWMRLRSRPALPGGGRAVLSPVVEQDVVETLARAVASESDWSGWYDVVGPEPLALAELAALASRLDPLPGGAGAWEPPHQEMEEHRLCDDRPWRERFGIVPRRVSREAAGWA